MARKSFSGKEKREHYNAIARGEKPVKGDTFQEQAINAAYAAGQAHARNEAARIFAFNKTKAEGGTWKNRKGDIPYRMPP